MGQRTWYFSLATPEEDDALPSARSLLDDDSNNDAGAGDDDDTNNNTNNNERRGVLAKLRESRASLYTRVLGAIADPAQRARCGHLIRMLPQLLLLPAVERFVVNSQRLYYYPALRDDVKLLEQVARAQSTESEWEQYDDLVKEATGGGGDDNASIGIEMEWQSVRLMHEQTGVIGTRLVASLVVDSRPMDAQAVFGFHMANEESVRHASMRLLPLYLDMLEDLCSEHEYRQREALIARNQGGSSSAPLPLQHTMVFEKSNTRPLSRYHESRELHRIYMEVPVQQSGDSPLTMQRLYLRNIEQRVSTTTTTASPIKQSMDTKQSMHRWERMLLYPSTTPLTILGCPPSPYIQADFLQSEEAKRGSRTAWDRRFTVHQHDGIKFLREDLTAGTTARRYLGDLLFSRDYLKVFHSLSLLGDSFSSLPYSTACAMDDEREEEEEEEERKSVDNNKQRSNSNSTTTTTQKKKTKSTAEPHTCRPTYRTPAIRDTSTTPTVVLTKEMLVPRVLPALTQLRSRVNFTFSSWIEAVHDVTRTSQLSGAPVRSPPKRTCFVRYEHYAGEMASMLAEDLVAARDSVFGQVRDVWIALSGDTYWIIEGLYRSGLFDTIHAVAVLPPSAVLVDRLMELSSGSSTASKCRILIIPHYLIDPIYNCAPTACPFNSNPHTERKALWHLNSYLTDLRQHHERLYPPQPAKSRPSSSSSPTRSTLNSKGRVNALRTDNILYWLQL